MLPEADPRLLTRAAARALQQHLALVPPAGQVRLDEVADFFIRRQLAVLAPARARRW